MRAWVAMADHADGRDMMSGSAGNEAGVSGSGAGEESRIHRASFRCLPSDALVD